MRLLIKELAGDDTLGGAAQGENLLGRLVTAGKPSTSSEPIFLDFAGVAIATYSYLRAAILGYRTFCNDHFPSNPVVLANVNSTVMEELQALLCDRRDALVICELDDGAIRNPRVVGVLDEMLATALRAVLDAGTADAPSLARKFEEGGRRFTKWNNRLSALARKGLLVERPVGRLKQYRPAFQDMTYGH